LKRNKVIGFCALFVSAFFLANASAFGQGNTIELLPGSDRISGDEKLGITYLAGNVSFKYQGNTMYCDSAVYYKKTKLIKAFRNVHITKPGGLNLFCNQLTYDSNTEVAFLEGDVRARDQEYKLTTNALEYDTKSGKATYRTNGKVESILGDEVLTSRVGYFYPESKDFFFKGNVKYNGPQMNLTTDTLQYAYFKRKVSFFGPTTIYSDSSVINCERGWYKTDTEEAQLMKNASISKGSQIIKGDTLLYQPQKNLSIGKGNVFVKDSTEKFEFHGDYMYKNDLTNKLFLTGHALAIQANEKDSLFIHADTLFSINDSLDEPSIIKAYYGVQIFQNNVQGKCDSLIYDKSTDVLQLYRNPILWANKGELKGDTMFVFLKDSVIDRVEIFLNATALFQVDTIGYYNQIAGRKMIAFFKNDEVHRADARGNAQTIYYLEETEENDSTVIIKRLGMNRLYASDLRVYLDSGEVIGITYYDKPDGKSYPMDQIDKREQFVPNFRWNPLLRPKSWQEMLK
jgi:lipopolysaccharide export system protein LptA|tara:strand:- start:41282 stop:42823 length:1542 start_codon:yes stop_codon:yes gene_type:complete